MKIAIIGGTGVYDSSFIKDCSDISVNTPYGVINLTKGKINDNEVYFMERHSKGHKIIPSNVNYKGNISALKILGIDFTIATAAVGGINNCNVGDFVILDQFIDFTKNRSCTFFDEENSGLVHVDMSEPYCSTIRTKIIEAFNKTGTSVIEKGTYVCTEGPRFETPAEINMYRILGADVVGMTNVPEVVLAREATLCYATIALVTNNAAGISNNPLTTKEVNENMAIMSDKLKNALLYFIKNISLKRNCSCRSSLDELNTIK